MFWTIVNYGVKDFKEMPIRRCGLLLLEIGLGKTIDDAGFNPVTLDVEVDLEVDVEDRRNPNELFEGTRQAT